MRPAVTAVIQRICSGTSVPGPRTWRTIVPCWTVSRHTVAASTVGTAVRQELRHEDRERQKRHGAEAPQEPLPLPLRPGVANDVHGCPVSFAAGASVPPTPPARSSCSGSRRARSGSPARPARAPTARRAAPGDRHGSQRVSPLLQQELLLRERHVASLGLHQAIGGDSGCRTCSGPPSAGGAPRRAGRTRRPRRGCVPPRPDARG
jgi:hypothetical protein